MPGTLLYDAGGGIPKLIADVELDIQHLQQGGRKAIMFSNENDRPYELKDPIEGIAAMTAVIESSKPKLKVPFSVNYLWDLTASIAAATGASLMHEIFFGVFASDMGVWASDCASAAGLWRTIGALHIKLFLNIDAEFGHSLGQRPIELRTKRTVFSSMADLVLASGPIAGQPADHLALQ
ncbi:hypothetical protein SAMN07250955_11772 [Arboricoccus pini]|uniref:3-keto-5-aminohexanoate cleavage enzyme n=1 Tax=Arboricoccus pini TaxID=1963835 RepID=A0A212RYY4_9PROT|nr:hypothetical protein SAMN07250955_11772 [Arboricoccus pini]